MGCDFELLIQVQYGSYWVTIVDFGTKTRCGGFPLCPAMRDLANKEGIVGGYGLQFPILPSDVDPVSFIISQIVASSDEKCKKPNDATSYIESEVEVVRQHFEQFQNEDQESTGSNELVDEEIGKDAEEEEETEEEYEARREKEFLYYSKEQFEELIKFIQPFPPTEYHPTMYIDIMTPVPKWCEMALTALPLDGGEIWMSDEPEGIQHTTKQLADKQIEMKEMCKEAYAKTAKKSKLPAELVHLIAEYAVGGKDVRVAFKDDEGQSGFVRRGDFSNHTPECIVM